MIVVAVFFFQLPSSIKTTFSPIPMINQQRAFYLRHLNYGHLFVPTLFIFPCDSLRVTSGHFRMYQKSRRKIKVKIITHSPISSHLNRVPPDNNGHVDLRHHHSSLFACKIINKWKLTTLCGGEKRVTSFRPSVLWDCAKIIITCIRRNDLRSPLLGGGQIRPYVHHVCDEGEGGTLIEEILFIDWPRQKVPPEEKKKKKSNNKTCRSEQLTYSWTQRQIPRGSTLIHSRMP